MQVAPYKPRKAFDARRVYDVWLLLVQDEQLYDAMNEGRHAEVARARGLTDEDILIIDDFRDQPGTRWHVDNLRFRCTTMVSRILRWHMPATVRLLTDDNVDWLRDLTYEYMTYNRWTDLGHHRRFAECARFAQFVRTRVVKRRRPPDHLEAVLSFELAVHDLLQQASTMPSSAWPGPVAADQPLARLKPVAAPVHRRLDLAVDIAGWLAHPEGKPVVAAAEPVTAVVFIPGPADPHRVERLDAAASALFDACRGERTADAIASASTLPDAAGRLRAWLDSGLLVQMGAS